MENLEEPENPFLDLNQITIIYQIACVAAILCSLILITTWLLMPKWRTLHNYISLHQILTGTLQLCFASILTEDDLLSILSLSNNFFFQMSLYWSFCNSLFIYLRLVFVYSGKLSYEKRIATAICFLTLLIIELCSLTEGWFKEEILLFALDDTMVALTATKCVPPLLIATFNLAIFFKVCKSVLSTKLRSSKNRRRNIVALLGVACFCDICVVGNLLVSVFNDLFYSKLSYVSYVTQTMFAFRLVPQTIVVLLNKRSRELWRRYWSAIKRRYGR